MTKTTAKASQPPRVTTPWGSATVVERVEVAQAAGDRRFASVLELLEDERGATLVRLSYSSGDATRRGPVTLRARDLARLRARLDRLPRLAELLCGDG